MHNWRRYPLSNW